MPKPRTTEPVRIDPLLFLAHFEELEDPRRHQHKVLYPLPVLLLIGFGAALCGLKDWNAAADFAEEKSDWLRGLYPFEAEETPSADTLERVFSRLDARVFRQCFLDWMRAVARERGLAGQQLALDGKSVQGARDPSAPTVPMHLLHAYVVDQGLLLGMEPVNGASGESAAAQSVLSVLEIRGMVVTGDANLLTRGVADRVVERGADYLFALKGNRGPAHDEVVKKLAGLIRCSTKGSLQSSLPRHTTPAKKPGTVE
jgi:hypothetical protein